MALRAIAESRHELSFATWHHHQKPEQLACFTQGPRRRLPDINPNAVSSLVIQLQAGTVANQAEQIQQAVSATIREEMGALRTFVDRRIAELSAEIHATVQLVDFSENNLSGQLSGIRDQISSVIAMPAAATRNSGFELEAVVQATEAAADRIMEAAEAISDWLREGKNDPASIEAVNEKVNAIFEACSFQDVTGQRIRRAIQHLQQVETMLTDIAPGEDGKPSGGVVVLAPYNNAGAITPEQSASNPDLAQDAVDSLFD
jgi:chemotaxis protein CheZ